MPKSARQFSMVTSIGVSQRVAQLSGHVPPAAELTSFVTRASMAFS